MTVIFLEGPTIKTERVNGGLFTFAQAHVELPDGRQKWIHRRCSKKDKLDTLREEITSEILRRIESNSV